RVTFPDRDNIQSWWLPIIQPKAQDDKVFWLPDIGEQVVVLMDEHDENGAVVGAIPSQVDTPPAWASANTFGVEFSDGTVLRYDRAAHVLTAAVVSGGAANVSTGKGNQVVLGSDGTALMQDAIGASFKLNNNGTGTMNCNLLVAGTIGTTSGTWGNGDAAVTGTMQATGEVTAKFGTGSPVNLSTHDTSDVQSGGGTSGPPVPNT
ncbi:MAG: phage baseplate assembly protein V, partial [Acetobacteraceae bacterium]